MLAQSWLSSLSSAPTVRDVINAIKLSDESSVWFVSQYGDWPLKAAVRDFATLKDESDYSDGVRVMTMHASKGLEFPNVFVDFAPSRRIVDEEWRLTYVAMTRAKEQLFVMGCENPALDFVEQWFKRRAS